MSAKGTVRLGSILKVAVGKLESASHVDGAG